MSHKIIPLAVANYRCSTAFSRTIVWVFPRVAATADLTVLTLARVLPHRWADQETRFGIEGRAASFDEIAQRENKVERHIRYLAPLAFVSPRIIEAIANGNAPADLTVSTLARKMPHSWAEQGHKLDIA
jgi:hypothetical protein